MLGGRFQLLRPLHRGTKTSVYEAENVTVSRRVAIKILEPRARLVASNARAFVREAKALARVSHPNVVSVIDIEEDRITSALFMVQELLEGCELRTLLRSRRPLSVEETLEIMLPIGEALEATHRAGLVHGNVTTANIFLATNPKLIDFGRAHRGDPRADVSAFAAVVDRCFGVDVRTQRRFASMNELLLTLQTASWPTPLRATA